MKELLIYMKRDEFLEVLRINAYVHLRDYAEQEAGYRLAVEKEAASIHDDAVLGNPIGLSRLLMLPQPRCYVSDYRDAIEGALQARPEATEGADWFVGMSPEDYECCVLDNWPWAEEFDAISELYASSSTNVSHADE